MAPRQRLGPALTLGTPFPLPVRPGDVTVGEIGGGLTPFLALRAEDWLLEVAFSRCRLLFGAGSTVLFAVVS